MDKMDVFLSEILGIENEYDILSKQAKTPEEIEKWCTKEDMPEVKRCVHLMKKGYEIQKISVINNLDRYMTENGSNEELFSLIIDSLMDWDDKMQKECASSFIKPLELDLINKRNKEKVAKAAIQITTDDDNAENNDLMDLWIKVLETVVSRLDSKFVEENITKVIKDIPSLKNPFAKRKRGNRLVFSVAKNVGEQGLNEDPLLCKLVMSICSDNNYKIRRDGCVFFKEYFQFADRKSILEGERFREIYLPTLYDFLNDEDLHIQIDAIEAVAEILDVLTKEEVEQEFVPCVLNLLDSENQNQLEITSRVAEIFGVILYKMKDFELHLTYKEQFINYYMEICQHKEESIRKKAVFNLPAMNMLYKSVEKEMKISFQELWLKFSEDENLDIRYCAASSIHEAFKIIEDDEDTTALRKCFLNFILDNSREILLLMNQNLVVMIQKYGNKHLLENFKGRTPYIETASEGSKESTPKSKPNQKNNNSDFSSALIDNNKKGLTKKNTHLGITFGDEYEDSSPKLPPIYVTSQHESELVYSDLLQRLMVFINNIRSHSGLWREHKKLINNLLEVIHLFYIPEVHQYLVPMLVDFVYKGNNQTKEASCSCLAKIMKYQHHTQSREELLNLVMKDMGQSSNWMQRKAFIYFCKYAVVQMSRDFFKKHFMKDYIALSNDKVPHVRMEFANAMLVIKPYFDNDVDQSLELMDVLNNLSNDSDRDVLEAVEHTDYELLQSRKKNKGESSDDADLLKVNFQKQLAVREKEEIEERKKRVDDEEESKYDMASFLADSKKWRQKAGKYQYKRPIENKFSRMKTVGASDMKGIMGSNSSTLKKLPLSGLNSTDSDAKTPIKKKNTLTTKKTSAVNGFSGEIDFQKQRKNSVLLGGTKDEQTKRYHQMVSNGSSTINGTTSNSKTQNSSTGKNPKPSGPVRRNTVMGVNGQIPHSNGL